MLKGLAIVALLCPLAYVGVLVGQDALKGTPKDGIVKQEPSKKGQEAPHAQSNNEPTPTLPPSTPKPATPTANHYRQDSSEESQINLWLMRFTGALAVVGLLQFIAVVWQAILLRQTRGDVSRQADWIETQAGYMSKQAGLMEATLRQIERQVSAQMDATNPLIIAVPENSVRSVAFFDFDWKPVNAGHTAAFIIETNTHFMAFKSLDDIPDTPVYEQAFEWNQKPILPGQEGDGDGVGLVTEPKMSVTDMDSEVADRKLRLFAYGRIKYRDIYGRGHETRFGFVWFPEVSRFDVGGPEQYNRYT